MAHLFQINVSNGGVPKTAVRTAEINDLGLTNDRQKHTKVHGGPTRAVCVYSLEAILALQAEGHPIYPGSIGENLTISGIEWTGIQPGTRFQVGPEVVLEVTSFAAPCNLIGASFVDGEFMRVSAEKRPGWARAYTKVVRPGHVRLGHTVKIAATTTAEG